MLGAESFKKVMSENPVNTSLEEVMEKPDVSQTTVIPQDVKINKVSEMFGLNPAEIGRFSSELNSIIEYATSRGALSLDDFMYEIRKLSDTLGNNMGEKKIKTVARFVFLTMERDKINRDIERMKSNE